MSTAYPFRDRSVPFPFHSRTAPFTSPVFVPVLFSVPPFPVGSLSRRQRGLKPGDRLLAQRPDTIDAGPIRANELRHFITAQADPDRMVSEPRELGSPMDEPDELGEVGRGRGGRRGRERERARVKGRQPTLQPVRRMLIADWEAQTVLD